LFCLATNEIAQTGLSSLPPVIYYSEQLFSTCHNRLLNYSGSDRAIKKGSSYHVKISEADW